MVKGPKHLTQGERLADLGLFNLKKKRLRLGEVIAVFTYLTGKWSQALFRTTQL